jgi:O-antigen/teichoic acid export membrane protein
MTSPARPDETRDQRDDRNLTDLLQELRVAGLGVQVLFGFLLGLPFTTRFDRLEQWQRWLYLTIMVLAAVSIVLLVAPVAYHRLVFRRHQREHLLRAANILSICGLATVSLAVSGAVLLVTSYVEPGAATVVAVVITAGMFGALWFLLPLTRREQAPDPPAGPGQAGGPPGQAGGPPGQPAAPGRAAEDERSER